MWLTLVPKAIKLDHKLHEDGTFPVEMIAALVERIERLEEKAKRRLHCEHLWYQADAIGPGPAYNVGGFLACKKCVENVMLQYKELELEVAEIMRKEG